MVLGLAAPGPFFFTAANLLTGTAYNFNGQKQKRCY